MKSYLLFIFSAVTFVAAAQSGGMGLINYLCVIFVQNKNAKT